VITSIFLKFLPGGSHPVTEELSNNPKFLDLLKVFFLACVVAPIWERSCSAVSSFLRFTKALGKPIYGALASSFLFAAIHPQGLLGVLPLMGIAMMLCGISTKQSLSDTQHISSWAA